MNQQNLNRGVAEATGESLDTVRRLGFWLVDGASSDPLPSDPEWDIAVIDWDELEARRFAPAMALGLHMEGGAYEL